MVQIYAKQCKKNANVCRLHHTQIACPVAFLSLYSFNTEKIIFVAADHALNRG